LAKAAAQTIKESLCVQAEQGAIIWTQSQGVTEWRRLRTEWKRAGPTHRQQEDQLWERLQAARAVFLGRIELEQSRRRDEAATAQQAKLDLCLQAEAATQLDDVRQAAHLVAGLMAQWREVKRTDPRIDNELWARFKAAQDQVFTRRQSADRARRATAAIHQDLIAQARGLIGSADLGRARAQMRQIIDDFRTAGFSGRDLNNEFKQVRDEFFSWVKAEPDRRRQSGQAGTYYQRARQVTDIGQLEAEIARLEAELAQITPGPSQRRHGSGLRLSLGAEDRHSQISAELMRLRLRRDQLGRRLGDIDARLAQTQTSPPAPEGPEELASTGLGADPQLQHGGEADLGVVQVEPADLRDPPQPIAQGVGMDEEAGGSLADIAETVQPSPQSPQ
jgi:hypothetical protein